VAAALNGTDSHYEAQEGDEAMDIFTLKLRAFRVLRSKVCAFIFGCVSARVTLSRY
jgi:hypothetical protein